MAHSTLINCLDVDYLSSQPEGLLDFGRTAAIEFPSDDVAHIQLNAVRGRFDMLRKRLPVLDNLAREQGVEQIGALNDAAMLLFKHSVYKSYPLSLVEKGRFDRLTQWLGKLTTVDLSAVRHEGVDSIDGWLDALLRDAGVRIVHSTGTSGKLSFLPIGPADSRLQCKAAMVGMEAIGGAVPVDLEKVPMIVVGHRVMFNGYGAKMEAMLKELYHGDESMVVVMEEGRLSADVLSLGGRLAAAENRGALGRSEISPAILGRLDAIAASQKEAPARKARFFERIFKEFDGTRVALSGNWTMLHEMVVAGRERGIRDGLFATDSLIQCAGGTKGKLLPNGFQNDIRRFFGVPRINEGYGMSEIPSLLGSCENGHYHAPPWLLVFVLDPVTGEPFPREGTHTGRFGVIDLTLQERWGGVLSGDQVTMSFDRCACGRPGPYLDSAISRFSEQEGGDDKITCAGAPEAHDNALAFLTELEGQ